MMAKLYSGTHVGLKLPDICLKGEENTENTSPRKLVPTGDRIGPAAWQARMLRLLHTGGLITYELKYNVNYYNLGLHLPRYTLEIENDTNRNEKHYSEVMRV